MGGGTGYELPGALERQHVSEQAVLSPGEHVFTIVVALDDQPSGTYISCNPSISPSGELPITLEMEELSRLSIKV
jgi:hypothetical protein